MGYVEIGAGEVLLRHKTKREFISDFANGQSTPHAPLLPELFRQAIQLPILSGERKDGKRAPNCRKKHRPIVHIGESVHHRCPVHCRRPSISCLCSSSPEWHCVPGQHNSSHGGGWLYLPDTKQLAPGRFQCRPVPWRVLQTAIQRGGNIHDRPSTGRPRIHTQHTGQPIRRGYSNAGRNPNIGRQGWNGHLHPNEPD